MPIDKRWKLKLGHLHLVNQCQSSFLSGALVKLCVFELWFVLVATGRFKIAFVTGERGIGKSSLVSLVRHLSEREESIAGSHIFPSGANV